MRRVVLRGFLARKLRALLTGLAIALGVTLMAGTYVLTDTINESFAGIFSTANEGIDVAITPRETVEGTLGDQSVPEAVLERVREVDGVAAAEGGIFTEATLLDAGGEDVGTGGGAPTFVASNQPEPFNPFEADRGRLPTADDEAAVDAATAEREGLDLGDTITLAGRAPARRYRVLGIASFGGSDSLGASAALVTLPQAQIVAGRPGGFDEVDVQAEPGVTPDELRARLRAELPPSLTVRTGDQQAQSTTDDLVEDLGFLRTFLLVFAYVALFVGGFIIFNTFSITVAQRTREFALLRTLGASRGQILRSVLAESLLLGLLGSLVGLLLGIAIAPGLNALFKAFGAELPAEGTVIATRTVVVSLAVGTVITLVAGMAPALRSTRVPPIAALREGTALPPSRLSRFAIPFAVLVLALGALAVAGGLVGGAGIAVLGLGALLVFLGVALLSPRLVPPIARVVGLTVSWRGVTGRLAQQNAVRQPGRTAVTASALMIGLALVTFVSFFAAGAKATIDRAVDRAGGGDLIVQNANDQSEQGIPTGAATAIARVDGVRVVSPVAYSNANIRGVGDGVSVSGVEPRTLPELYEVDWTEGSDATLAGLGRDGAVLTKGFADDEDLEVGERLAVLTPRERRLTLTVRGIVEDDAGLFTDVTVARSLLLGGAFGVREDDVDFIGFDEGADAAAVQRRVEALLDRSYPSAEAQTAEEFKDQASGDVDQFITLIYVLLSLAVIVALFGVANTLALAIFERQRELGMLRAIGTARRQVRQMIRYEAIVTACIGGVLGLVLGAIFAVVVTRPLAEDGFVLAVPYGRLLIILVLAAVIGIIAAALPARRAAKVRVLEALAYE